MSRGAAALRGAGAAALSAALTLAACAAIAGAHATEAWSYPVRMARMVVDVVRGGGGLLVFTLLLASTAVGAALGLLSRRLRIRPGWRGLVLAAGAAVALYVPVWAVLAVSSLAAPAPERLPLRVSVYVATLFAAYGLVLAGPVLVPGALLGAVLLERWTRPEALPPRIPRPTVRRGALLVLVAIASALTTFAALTWLWR